LTPNMHFVACRCMRSSAAVQSAVQEGCRAGWVNLPHPNDHPPPLPEEGCEIRRNVRKDGA
jgi:hypothetical protein